MKLGTVQIDGVDTVVVALDDDHAAVVDGGRVPADVGAVLARWPADADRLEAARSGSPAAPVETLTWRPPVVRPGKVVCVALNNSANRQRIISGPDHPATFLKPASSLVGHLQPIRLRKDFGRVHPEPELAVVVGRGGTDIEPESALDHVFGYTIFNDLTAPTLRSEDTFHYRAIHPGATEGDVSYVDTWVSYPGRYKGADTFGPIGPWIVTRDEVPDPHRLTVRCVHQGRLVTEDSTANLRHSVPDVLSFVSRWMTLEPGDIVAMGTALSPAAGGSAVQNVDLTRLGGPVEVEISGIGVLRNEVEYR
ncbi:MAG: fumarylacetoacetate hydrolase family protein [Acidimicrobiales bacterium]